MTFLHPLALLGLVAAAIPALLHLLQRRTPPELEFPPLRYLSEAERRSARRLRLRHLLLLVLRTALIVVIVLAAARPLVPVAARAGSAGLHQPTALVVILDDSPSSGAVVDGRPVLDRLRSAARASLARAAPPDRVWLMLADGLLRGGSREALLAVLDSMAGPGVHRLELGTAVARAARLVEAEPLPAREVHVLSDLQRSALGGSPAVGVPRGVRVLALAPLSSQKLPVNRGIAAARVAEGAVAISIAGTLGAGPAPVTVHVRGREVDGGRALVAPGAGLTVALPPLPPGWWVGEVRLEPDELRADDRGLFVWRVAPPAWVRTAAAAGEFIAAALGVLRDAHRVSDRAAAAGAVEVAISDQPESPPARTVVLPPADPALVGQVNRALAARGVRWAFASLGGGTPGPIAAPELSMIAGVQVRRRYRLEPRSPLAAATDSATVLASVNGDPWLVRTGPVALLGSRLDTAWTALPAAPGFVPFVDALVNRVARGEAPIAAAEGLTRVDFQTRGGGADTVGATVYGPDPRESDLTPASAELVRRAFGGVGGADAAVLTDAEFAAERFAGARRADVSGLLLALALTLAVVELGVATLTR